MSVVPKFVLYYTFPNNYLFISDKNSSGFVLNKQIKAGMENGLTLRLYAVLRLDSHIIMKLNSMVDFTKTLNDTKYNKYSGT